MNREDIIRMAREADRIFAIEEQDAELLYEFCERFAALVAAAERKECIKACDSVDLIGADECIEAIRARGEQ